METVYIYILLAGFAGGAVRGLSGWIRSWPATGDTYSCAGESPRGRIVRSGTKPPRARSARSQSVLVLK